ncbi:UDP-N-acetylglucosamine-dolichyl-phosphate N-AceGluNH-phosphotransferase [Pyrococcus sp. NA2]|uniref:MraY family glycosyltransferase n=1 Tax=Pyrococcus sp. (strain NA2) TaxID=342949 RepID=UPI000209A926|nr:glycosyltransferase 4 family protein [Pyrococcus sp. NA2]AEC51875.1 UDP-N-acetylglucosamine-dolichyl-phosphate N-AceGluNH-phosphotransferase [Pyrococcus sp. NA2]
MIEFLSFVLAFLLTPYFGKLMKNAGITGIDVHKREKYEVPEMGGLALLISISVIALAAGIESWMVGVFLLVGLVGVLDDLVELRQSHKVLLTSLATFPVLLNLKRHYIVILGSRIDLGFLALIFFWAYVAISANLVNMLAGFNGLEVGLSSIMFLIISILAKGPERRLALIALFASLGFLYWNKYPAKVFPGDTGTLALGALIGLLAVSSGLEFPVGIMLIPHITDFLLKAKVKFKGKSLGRTRVLEDGTLVPPPYLSFLGLIMRIRPMKEWELVLITLIIEAFLGALAILLA